MKKSKTSWKFRDVLLKKSLIFFKKDEGLFFEWDLWHKKGWFDRCNQPPPPCVALYAILVSESEGEPHCEMQGEIAWEFGMNDGELVAACIAGVDGLHATIQTNHKVVEGET